MVDFNTIGRELEGEVEELEREVQTVYREIVEPRWNTETRRYPQTLYGYVMKCFALVDLVSCYWSGPVGPQTQRMVDFMERYLGADRDTGFIAVQMWRHTLMHTGAPRELLFDGVSYKWLLHWDEELPSEQHLTLGGTGANRVLRMSLRQLASGLKVAVSSYLGDLAADSNLQVNLAAVLPEVRQQKISKPKWWRRALTNR